MRLAIALAAMTALLVACGDNATIPTCIEAGCLAGDPLVCSRDGACECDGLRCERPSCHVTDTTPGRCDAMYPGAGLHEESCDPGVDLRHPTDGIPTDCYLADGLICCR